MKISVYLVFPIAVIFVFVGFCWGSLLKDTVSIHTSNCDSSPFLHGERVYSCSELPLGHALQELKKRSSGGFSG